MPRISASAAALPWIALSCALAPPAVAGATGAARYEISLTLTPAASGVAAAATVAFPGDAALPDGFLLAASLKVTTATPPVAEIPLGDAGRVFSNNDAGTDIESSRVKRYRFTAPPLGRSVTVRYEGTIDAPLDRQEQEYARGFRETTGRIAPEGVYLAGSSFWYPRFDGAFTAGLVSFALEARVPGGWHVISQGTGTSRGTDGVARWSSPDPMDEIYLVGGPLHEWRDSTGTIETLAYLRDRDDALARKYLDATAQYLAMYRELIGPYPYTKFALVENFWETGYGMPSFTLLGSSVIRFPFILTSSYPHEILHNWWGNGVFVDYGRGNWCEGLTAYLADHLIQEQRGAGATYRRTTLQKYRDYVTSAEGRDFALTAFRGRHSAATEAIGYGRMLIGTHMLRRALGERDFTRFLQRFYREQRGKSASFDDFRATAQAVAGERRPLDALFSAWIERDGAPSYVLENAAVTVAEGRPVVTAMLAQTQASAPYAFDVPLVVQLADGRTVASSVTTSTARTSVTIALDAGTTPVALHVDPEFDVFRRLDPRETPPSLSMIFGDPAITAILPADPAQAERYRALAGAWNAPQHAIAFAGESDLKELPKDRSVWVLGAGNRWGAELARAERRFRPGAEAWSFGGENASVAGASAVVVVRHPSNPLKGLGWIVADPPGAGAGLSRKLPHYGRYSYLAFSGNEPTNVLKGEWTPDDSPLRVDLRPAAERGTALAAPKFAARRALVDLPPVFSAKALGEHVAWLAAPEREGRGIGTQGIDDAARYVAAAFRKAGLEPAGAARDGDADAGYFQPFAIDPGPGGKPAATRNVIGVLRGTKPELAGSPLVVSAHYDHLGRGWPEARTGAAGQVHPGADDNASGVAVLIELARAFAAGEKPARPVVFAAFSGEEARLAGAKAYLANPVPAPVAAATIYAVINLDTVGRLRSGKVQILGTGTSNEWPHIFRGGSFVTGVESTSIPGNAEASDQHAFIERGIPGVQVFTGPHEDYHRPGDTVDKVDVAGLVSVATLVKEAVAYLANRVEPLTGTPASTVGEGGGAPAAGQASRPSAGSAPGPPSGPGGAGAQGGAGAPGARRVSFGAVPDFEYQGPGVRLSGVGKGSPAETAGLAAGDVLATIDGRAVNTLAEFGALLRTLSPGQTVDVVFTRDGATKTARVTVVER